MILECLFWGILGGAAYGLVSTYVRDVMLARRLARRYTKEQWIKAWEVWHEKNPKKEKS